MTPADQSEDEKIRRARLNRAPVEEPPLENLPRDWDKEDLEMEGRKPDLGETEDDPSEF